MCLVSGTSGQCVGTPKPDNAACFGKDGALWKCKGGQCLEPAP
jgi:hypothetical protein